jgi:hypothetical protein
MVMDYGWKFRELAMQPTQNKSWNVCRVEVYPTMTVDKLRSQLTGLP